MSENGENDDFYGYDLPVDESQGSGIVEYLTGDNEMWGVDDFKGLSELFSMGAGDLGLWHGVVSGTGRAWEVIRKLYGVASLITDDPDDLRKWKIQELAKKYGVAKGQLEMEVQAAVRTWSINKARASVDRETISGLGADDLKKLISHARTDDMDEGLVGELLRAFNFDDVKDSLLRAQVAKRILSLREYLSGDHTRTQARQIIRLEISIHGQERLQSKYHNELDEALDKDGKLIASKDDIEALRKKIKQTDQEMRSLLKAHGDLQKQIGADETDLTARKQILVDSVAYIMEQCRLFESDPENWKVDGIFTAGQIEWLTEPMEERPPQYRPDIVLRLQEALMPENLWNPKYVPTPIQANMVQRLRKLVERATSNDEIISVRDDDEDDDDADDELTQADPVASLAAVPVDVGSMDMDSAPNTGYQFAGAGRGGADVMGVF